jgi:hypothetical protein
LIEHFDASPRGGDAGEEQVLFWSQCKEYLMEVWEIRQKKKNRKPERS